MSKTFTFVATPVVHTQHDGYATTSFWLFGKRYEGVIKVETPGDIAVALRDWAHEHDPATATDDPSGEGVPANAWSMYVVKPARWPQGFKQLGEQSHTFVV